MNYKKTPLNNFNLVNFPLKIKYNIRVFIYNDTSRGAKTALSMFKKQFSKIHNYSIIPGGYK